MEDIFAIVLEVEVGDFSVEFGVGKEFMRFQWYLKRLQLKCILFDMP
jgi:hypothetical protein